MKKPDFSEAKWDTLLDCVIPALLWGALAGLVTLWVICVAMGA